MNEIQQFEQALVKDKEGILIRLKKYTKINETTGCHIWEGNTCSAGYGTIKLTIKPKSYALILTHRLSSYLANPQKYDSNLYVLHRCDNRRCVNAEHLFQGTSQDNSTDCSIKGRYLKGEKLWNVTLTKAQVIEIRSLWTTGMYTQTELAIKFDVASSNIQRIVNNKTWKHI